MRMLGVAALVAAALFSTSAMARDPGASGPAAPPAATAVAESSIPPNCTLDPWTGRLTCHIWPTCTIDPWTGKMTCPVPRLEALQAE